MTFPRIPTKDRQMPDLIPMDFDGNEVSYFLDDQGEPWWPAQGPCVLLGYDKSNISHILGRLDEDEKELKVITSGRGNAGKQWCVNEPGMFSLILWSEKPEAKTFKRWLTHEVLPAIRKHGRYTITDRDIISGFLSPVFLPWEKRFELDFFQAVCRVYGQPIPTDDKHSPMVGWFIGKYVYDVLPVVVRAEMDIVNPIVDKKAGTRKLKLHQLLKEERVKDFLEKRITQLMSVMASCRGQHAKELFRERMAVHDDTQGIRVSLPLSRANRTILSMILPEQISLFPDEEAGGTDRHNNS
jgi:prophage antirepressor-like protein